MPPKAETKTKGKLFDAAKGLMLSKGYPATTVDEICEAAGVTKGSFFHYFDSKEDLGKELLDCCGGTMEAGFKNAAFHQEKDPLKRIHLYLDSVIQCSRDRNNPKGCLIGTLAQELSDVYPDIRSSCAKYFSKWADCLTADLNAAKGKHLRHLTFDSRSLADHLISILEGSFILAKTYQDSRIVEENLKHFRRYLDSLFK